MAVWMALLLCSSVQAEEEKISAHEALGAMFLQISTEAFMSAFEDTEERSNSNTQAITEIKKSLKTIQENLAFLAKQYQDSHYQSEIVKNGAPSPVAVNEMDQQRLEKLEQELAAIKVYLSASSKASPHQVEQSDSSQPNEVPVDSILTLRLATSRTIIRAQPREEAKNLGEIHRAEEVKVHPCNRYGWCKLANREGYVKRHLFVLE